jgi:hypothetical protein
VTPQALQIRVPVIPGEQFVATVPRQRHGDLGTGQAADQQNGYLRGISERLVPDAG